MKLSLIVLALLTVSGYAQARSLAPEIKSNVKCFVAKSADIDEEENGRKFTNTTKFNGMTLTVKSQGTQIDLKVERKGQRAIKATGLDAVGLELDGNSVMCISNDAAESLDS